MAEISYKQGDSVRFVTWSKVSNAYCIGQKLIVDSDNGNKHIAVHGYKKGKPVYQSIERWCVRPITNLKYKVGDQLMIDNNTSGHGFPRGTPVRIVKVGKLNYQVI